MPAIEHLRLVEPERRCSYLPQETASLEYRFVTGLSEPEFQDLLRRGWRRHGAQVFRPACPICRQCRSLRVDVTRFAPSKSQRRCLKRNADVSVVMEPPTVTTEHVRLYNAWHADMSVRRGWPRSQTGVEEYARGFLSGKTPVAREMLYFRGDRLIGVGLVDLVSDGLSSVYFYHDPEWRDGGPGVFSALQEIEFCRATGRRWWYAGYWIAECPSMAYKAGYVPHQVLERYVADDEEPVWCGATNERRG
jgi:arginine-tRNA-protein transferase